ncbi:MAG TPA: cytidylate kinase-like family protein [Candidatus Binatia bacterium]
MPFDVICISQTDGSGGAGIGRAVADRLGFRYADEEVIVQAAHLAQVDPAVVAAAEQRQNWLQRFMDAMTTAQDAIGTATLAAGMVVPTVNNPWARRASKDDLRSLIRAAIHELGKAGSAVIGAHAASHALAGKPEVLRVLITAPAPVRCTRVAASRSIPIESATEAIAAGDQGRREYFRVFYELDEELPTQYDLVLNTEHLTAEQVTEVIVHAARG